jgi:hypothetical protein
LARWTTEPSNPSAIAEQDGHPLEQFEPGGKPLSRAPVLWSVIVFSFGNATAVPLAIGP